MTDLLANLCKAGTSEGGRMVYTSCTLILILGFVIVLVVAVDVDEHGVDTVLLLQNQKSL